MESVKLEIACNHYLSCLHAEQHGAQRIELFENLPDGGCTPSFGMIKQVKQTISIPVYVMIRPRGGDFCYSKDEFEIMQHDVEQCLHLNVDGIVFGILKEDGMVDTDRCKVLQQLWRFKPITFHRAIDRAANIMHAGQAICAMGFERILSSGGAKDVNQGKEKLLAMQKEFGQHIIIMPGAGITTGNIRSIVEFCEVSEVHATAKKEIPSRIGTLNPAFNDNLSWSDPEYIAQLYEQLNNRQYKQNS